MATIKIDQDYIISEISPLLFSSFIEHMGRSVYHGIYEPTHSEITKEGFRTDVLASIKELNLPLVRYPGGNFVSGYNWKDGIGTKRQPKLDLAWRQIEPNEIGLHEFMHYSKLANFDVMMAVNMGTGTPKEAGELVEYCNISSGSEYSNLRIKNGDLSPFNIKYWCLGNEMDGSWQINSLTADEYGRKAHEAAKIMRWIDPKISLIASGSSGPWQPTYPVWDRVILEHLYDDVNFLSIHRYYSLEKDFSTADYLSSHIDLEKYIDEAFSVIKYVKALKRSKHDVFLSLDEWNIWHQKPIKEEKVYNNNYEDEWTVGPRRVENTFDFEDALTFFGLIISIINNCDKVKISCLAQLVNVIAPIMTENNGRMVKQTIYYPFQLARIFSEGVAIKPIVDSETINTHYGISKSLHCAVVKNENEYRVFILNKSPEDSELNVILNGNLGIVRKHISISGQLHAKNTFDYPNQILPIDEPINDEKKITLKGQSINVLVLKESK